MVSVGFLQGRDLAVKMLREAEAIRKTDDDYGDRADILAENRAARHGNPRPQDNFVLAYLKQVEQCPGLRDGFAAVLSDVLVSAGGIAEPGLYEHLTIEQMLGEAEGRPA